MNGINNINLPLDGVVAYIRSISDVVRLHEKLHGNKKKVLLIIHPSIIPVVDFLKLTIDNLAGIYPPSKLDDLYNVKFNVDKRKKRKVKITFRDRQILKLMIGGGRIYSLSRATGIPAKTLYSRKNAIYKKFGLHNGGMKITDDIIFFLLRFNSRIDCNDVASDNF